MIRFKGRNVSAYRAYYMLFIGPIDEGKQLDHLCRNRKCVNPSHLEPVTLKENVRRGLTAKITIEKAREIRLLARPGNNKVLAERFGVSIPTISMIVHGHRWREEDGSTAIS